MDLKKLLEGVKTKLAEHDAGGKSILQSGAVHDLLAIAEILTGNAPAVAGLDPELEANLRDVVARFGKIEDAFLEGEKQLVALSEKVGGFEERLKSLEGVTESLHEADSVHATATAEAAGALTARVEAIEAHPALSVPTIDKAAGT